MLYFRAFGRLELTHADGTPASRLLNQPKRLALLAYLVINSPHGLVRRDTLLALFWPELDAERARRALRQAIHVLKSSVGNDIIVTRGDEDVGVDPAKVWCDIVSFEHALSEGRLPEALDLYKGDAFAGLFVPDAEAFEAWLEELRGNLKLRAAKAAMQTGDFKRASELAPMDEAAVRAAMEKFDNAGNRGSALKVYEEFAARLQAEYEVDPSPETTAFAERIRNRSDVVNEAATRSRPPIAESASPLLIPSSSRGRVWLQAALLAAVILSVAGFAVWRRATRHVPPPELSVAVLPFVDMSEGGNQQHLTDGMTEELITKLSKVDGLLVPARTSSFVFKQKEESIGDIAEQLGVAHVLEGSIRREGNRVRVTAQLIDARTGYHLWSENFDRELDDLFKVQDDISIAIANALKVRIVDTRDRAADKRPNLADAYELYLKGRYYWHQRNREGVTKAIQSLSEAVTLDPSYAAAYSALADAYQLAPTFAAMPPDSAFPLARAAAEKALQLDSTLAEPWASIGYIKMHWDHDWLGSEVALRRAIELNPGYATAYQWLRINLLARGHATEAVAAALHAQKLDPLSSSIQAAVGDTYFYTGQYKLAAETYRNAVRLDPAYARVRSGLARASWFAGKKREALNEQNAAVSTSRGNNYFTGMVGSTYGVMGRETEARAILQQLRANSAREYVPAYAFAAVYAGLGEVDSALVRLREAVREKDNWTVYIPVEPIFAKVRARPEYKDIQRQLGLL
ncbi:MAG TPA: tetratricopeptide repeat protein [Longimicrobiales bacterium]|nr:tetratricopeptide repeat protein [Longimicrobiales bacterium]